MKTIYILVIFSLFFSESSDAQNWALPSSKWVETEFDPWGGYYWSDNLFVEKYTIIQSILCAKIVGDSLSYQQPIYTYSSGDTAYAMINGTFKAILYFGAHVGDTVLFYTDGNTSFDSIPYLHGRVDSISLISAAGQSLKKFNVSIIDTFPSYIFPRQIAYAEKIGFLSTYPSIFYQVFSTVVDADSYGFCTYGDSSISGFWLYPDSNCRTNVGIKEVPADELFSVYPNPVSDYLHIKTQFIGYTIKLYDMTGRESPAFINGNEIDIRSLSAGIYFITVSDNEHQTYTRKFIKE